ncbi:MAG TPA: anti-sigma factor [Pyrinomonadaceae bacterium]|jgi:anti-sigma-K factor RskA
MTQQRQDGAQERANGKLLMGHDDYREMLAEHALGALDAGEARALDEHLAACEDCRAELSQWLDTTAALAYSVKLTEPPPALRSRLLENVRARGAQPSVSTTKTSGDSRSDSRSETTTTVASPAAATKAAANVVSISEHKRSSWNTFQKFGALAASLAFIAFLITLAVLWNRNRAMQAEMARMNRDLQSTKEQLKREREISGMFTAPDTRVATLTGTEMAPRARARLAYNNAGSAMMIVDQLPPAPDGMDYQIWFIADGKPLPGGVFKPDATGHAEMRDQVPASARTAAAFAVTLEPQGGTSAPTGQKYLLSTASS